MTSHHGTHNDLHSEQGALPGEHPGRAKNPIIKVLDLAWLEFEKPDLAALGAVRARVRVHHREPDGGRAAAARDRRRRAVRDRPPRDRARRFLGAAFRAADSTDVVRLADATGRTVEKLPESMGGLTVDLTDPSGVLVRVVADTHELAALPRPADAGVQLRARRAARQRHAAPAA